MYGIMTQDGHSVLCNRTGTNVYIFKKWDRAAMPAMRSSAYEIDQLLQTMMVAAKRYGLVVFEFTEEQVANLLIKKLQGY